ncbi:putative group 1 glycosyl transferase [Magnetofaba australis IT-1]|uniref:Putative group 1 glycosyl transferase n=1 Tax=Magnetofaba australis IT-1 TaxID=1434232 RepID=A0A1Y2K851_9PROT|nr:putative group 1 glycosyl transferase [Magnetofaba australis IT-1]
MLHRFDIGGMESVFAALIDRLPRDRFRHTLIALTEVNPAFRQRMARDDVAIYSLHKREGKDWAVWGRLYRLLRRIRPDVLHSGNIAAVEGQFPAWLAGVRRRVHAEHGRDWHDLDGSNRKYQLLRRLLNPFVQSWVPVSQDLARWMEADVGLPARKIRLIVNGVDLTRYAPDSTARAALAEGGIAPDHFVIGCVGRFWPVKDHANLLRAFAHLLATDPEARQRARLVIVGDGLLREQLHTLARKLEITPQIWFAGARDDAPRLLAAMDLFALPSLAEGTPLTILEAMATGLPVVATAVGGVPDLLAAEETGLLVPPADPNALGQAMQRYLHNPSLLADHGAAGRARAAARFDLAQMIDAYADLFEETTDSER